MRPRGIAVEDRVDEQSPAVSTENEENSMSQPEVQEKQSDNAILTAPEEIEIGIDLESPSVQLLDSADLAEESVPVATFEPDELKRMMEESQKGPSDPDAGNSCRAESRLPNGDLVVGVRIPEYFVEPCRQFAEADSGKSLDQWCSEFFVQALEAYCTPLKGR